MAVFLRDITVSSQSTCFTLGKYWATTHNIPQDSSSILQRKVKSCCRQMQRALLEQDNGFDCFVVQIFVLFGSRVVIYISFIQRFLVCV